MQLDLELFSKRITVSGLRTIFELILGLKRTISGDKVLIDNLCERHRQPVRKTSSLAKIFHFTG